VEAVIRICGGDTNRWRPHVKTTKSTVLWRDLVAKGITNFKCATPREALVLGTLLKEETGYGDVVLAFPLVGPNLTRLQQVAETIAPVKLSVLVESVEDVAAVSDSIDIFADVNPGMDRSGMQLEDAEAGKLLDVAIAAGRRFRGIHFYDGHAGSFADAGGCHHGATPAMGPGDRKAALWGLYDRCVALFDVLTDAGIEMDEVITSGSMSIGMCIDHPGLANLAGRTGGKVVHRASAGSVVLHDLNSDLASSELRNHGLVPAAVVATRVVSNPNPSKGIFTLDCGSKSIACEAGHPVGYVVGHPEFQPLGPSEEHMPVEGPAGTEQLRGSIQYVIPRHVCPTVNLAEHALWVDDDLTAVPIEIDARAHELLLIQ